MISETRFNLSISNSIDRSIDKSSNIRSINGLWDSSSKCLAANPYDHPLVGLTPAPSSATPELPRINDLIRVIALHATVNASGSLTYLMSLSIASNDSYRLATTRSVWCLHRPQVMLSWCSGMVESLVTHASSQVWPQSSPSQGLDRRPHPIAQRFLPRKQWNWYVRGDLNSDRGLWYRDHSNLPVYL